MIKQPVFQTPDRISQNDYLAIRSFVHNIKTNIGSKIQSIQTATHLFKATGDTNEVDKITLGHYDEESGEYQFVGEFKHDEMFDWIITDMPTYQEGNVPKYLNVTEIRNHYKYLDLIWDDFYQLVFNKAADQSPILAQLVSDYSDNAYLYREGWAKKSIPFYHGVLIYILAHVEKQLDKHYQSNLYQFVIDQYSHYLPMILAAEKKQLIEIKDNA